MRKRVNFTNLKQGECMKKTILLTVLSILLLVPAASHAASGSAILPYYKIDHGVNKNIGPEIFLSNINSTSTTINITFFDKAGDIIYDTVDTGSDSNDGYFQANNISSWTENTSSGSSYSFDLGAGDTCQLYTREMSLEYGRVVIEWEQSGSTDPIALVGWAEQVKVDTSGSYPKDSKWSVSINNGLPF